MNELSFRKRFCEEMEKFNLRTWKIETGSTALGIPDVHWINRSNGDTGWVELKLARYPPMVATYERGQADWLYYYWAYGGAAWTVIYVESTNSMVVFPGSESKTAERCLADCQRISTIPLKLPEAWDLLRRHITQSN